MLPCASCHPWEWNQPHSNVDIGVVSFSVSFVDMLRNAKSPSVVNTPTRFASSDNNIFNLHCDLLSDMRVWRGRKKQRV